jgi:enoyl reductase-like protein
MKTLFFGLFVIASAYYLASQTEWGKGKLTQTIMPSTNFAQASDELLQKVQKQMQEFTTALATEQQQKMVELKQDIARLSEQVDQQNLKIAALLSLNSEDNSALLATQVEASEQGKEQIQNVAVLSNAPLDTLQEGLTADNNVPDSSATLRKRQAHLQDIASHMEQVSLKVASNSY